MNKNPDPPAEVPAVPPAKPAVFPPVEPTDADRGPEPELSPVVRRIIDRRKALALLAGGSVAAFLAACTRSSDNSTVSAGWTARLTVGV